MELSDGISVGFGDGAGLSVGVMPVGLNDTLGCWDTEGSFDSVGLNVVVGSAVGDSDFDGS